MRIKLIIKTKCSLIASLYYGASEGWSNEEELFILGACLSTRQTFIFALCLQQLFSQRTESPSPPQPLSLLLSPSSCSASDLFAVPKERKCRCLFLFFQVRRLQQSSPAHVLHQFNFSQLHNQPFSPRRGLEGRQGQCF